MPAFRMFLVAAAGTLMALFAGPLGIPAGPRRCQHDHQPAHRGRHELDELQRCGGVRLEPAERRVVHDLHLLRGGGLGEPPRRGRTLIEQWNGTTWTVVPSVNAPATTGDTLNSVSCVATTFCLAVGGSTTGPVAETWNGTSWSFVTAAATGG